MKSRINSQLFYYFRLRGRMFHSILHYYFFRSYVHGADVLCYPFRVNRWSSGTAKLIKNSISECNFESKTVNTNTTLIHMHQSQITINFQYAVSAFIVAHYTINTDFNSMGRVSQSIWFTQFRINIRTQSQTDRQTCICAFAFSTLFFCIECVCSS